MPPKWRIAHLAIRRRNRLNARRIDWALDGDLELRRVERAIGNAERDGNDAALARLHTEFDDLGGYAAEARAAEILNGLGFAASELQRPYREFSGGWRIRLNLAQTLMSPSDLLLLDEPTNHLDLDAMLWLESHLESLLRDACWSSLTIASSSMPWSITPYIWSRAGRPSTAATTVRSSVSEATLSPGKATLARRQARKAEEIMRFVDRFRAKSSKARQVQSRLKALRETAARRAGARRLSVRVQLPESARRCHRC